MLASQTQSVSCPRIEPLERRALFSSVLGPAPGGAPPTTVYVQTPAPGAPPALVTAARGGTVELTAEGTLYVRGTHRRDRISTRSASSVLFAAGTQSAYWPLTVTINGTEAVVDASAVKKIVVEAGRGRDQVFCDSVRTKRGGWRMFDTRGIPVEVDDGPGRDRVVLPDNGVRLRNGRAR